VFYIGYIIFLQVGHLLLSLLGVLLAEQLSSMTLALSSTQQVVQASQSLAPNESMDLRTQQETKGKVLQDISFSILQCSF
jgi:hypothetical protein